MQYLLNYFQTKMIDLLKQYGFKYTGSCNCIGIFTEKYKKGEYMIKWRRKRYTFAIFLNNAKITGWLHVKDLEAKLKELKSEIDQKNKAAIPA